jgi:hypothetical protein
MNLSASLFLELDLMGDGRLHHNIVSSSARTRPILSVTRYTRINQSRVQLRKSGIVHTVLLQCAGEIVLDQDVTVFG